VTDPLRVLVFLHCSGLVGAERSVLELVHELRVDHGVSVTVVLPYDGPLRERLEDEGAVVLIVDLGWWCDFDKHRLWQSAARLYGAIRERPTDFDTDVVATMSITIPWGALTASVLRKPHVWYVRETGDYLPLVFPLRRVVEIIDESSNAVIAISKAVRGALAAIADEKMSIVHPYIPESVPRARVGERSPRERPRLVFPGSKTVQKGQEDAIRAVAVLAARGRLVDLALIGPGTDLDVQRLASVVAELGVGDNVDLADFRDDVLEVVADADIMVDCSREAALDRVLTESMLIGTPVVAARSGGAIELCQEGAHGLLYTPGDPEDLARAIEAVLDDAPETAARVRRAGEFARNRNQRERYGPVVYDRLRSLAGRPNPTPQGWSGFFLDLLTHADTAWQVATGEVARLAAVHAETAAERDAARAENQQLAGEIERHVAECQRASAAQAAAAIQHQRLQIERDEIRGEFDRVAREYSDAARAFEAHIAATDATLAAIEATLGWRILQRIRTIRDLLLPIGTRRRGLYSWLGRTLGPG